MKNLLLIQVQDHQVVSVQKVPPQTIFLYSNDNTIRNISLGPVELSWDADANPAQNFNKG